MLTNIYKIAWDVVYSSDVWQINLSFMTKDLNIANANSALDDRCLHAKTDNDFIKSVVIRLPKLNFRKDFTYRLIFSSDDSLKCFSYQDHTSIEDTVSNYYEIRFDDINVPIRKIQKNVKIFLAAGDINGISQAYFGFANVVGEANFGNAQYVSPVFSDYILLSKSTLASWVKGATYARGINGFYAEVVTNDNKLLFYDDRDRNKVYGLTSLGIEKLTDTWETLTEAEKVTIFNQTIGYPNAEEINANFSSFQLKFVEYSPQREVLIKRIKFLTVPKQPVIIIQKNFIDLKDIEKVISLSIMGKDLNVPSLGITTSVRCLLTADNQNFYTVNGSDFKTPIKVQLDEPRNNWINATNLTSVNEEAYKTILGDEYKEIGVVFNFETNEYYGIQKVDYITLSANFSGYWESAEDNLDYTYSYKNSRTISFNPKFATGTKYIINYYYKDMPVGRF